MIKSFIILVLLVLVAAVAFLTRPSQASFQAYYKSQSAGTGKLSVAGVLSGFEADSYLRGITFHDRLLWTSVDQNGQTQYVGAFTHWFATSGAPAAKS